jgi:hypothetical protein
MLFPKMLEKPTFLRRSGMARFLRNGESIGLEAELLTTALAGGLFSLRTLKT